MWITLSEPRILLSCLDKGQTVTFTDMTGIEYDFRVDSVYHRQNFEPEPTEQSGELVLFTYLNEVSKYLFVTCHQ